MPPRRPSRTSTASSTSFAFVIRCRGGSGEGVFAGRRSCWSRMTQAQDRRGWPSTAVSLTSTRPGSSDSTSSSGAPPRSNSASNPSSNSNTPSASNTAASPTTTICATRSPTSQPAWPPPSTPSTFSYANSSCVSSSTTSPSPAGTSGHPATNPPRPAAQRRQPPGPTRRTRRTPSSEKHLRSLRIYGLRDGEIRCLCQEVA